MVCTIHQPQTKIFNILDNLILMKKGTILYQGAGNCAEKYFASYGFPCPDRYITYHILALTLYPKPYPTP